ncbi:response regulator [Cohnella sp. REN36]|uniref:response regulator transcription factor n=1 Tax=Cohnella sp. REN36 TaxID=2887347 RepID=UPI001D142941|nr:response regulator [Cohnella sp. REN36]
MTKPLEASKWHEKMYQAYVEQYWLAEENERTDCGIILVRIERSWGETMQAIRAIVEPEDGVAVREFAEADRHRAAFLLFGASWNRSHYTALRIKRLLAKMADGAYSILLAGAAEQAERNPQFFEALSDLFEQAPLDPNLILFHELYQSNETQSVLLVDSDEEVRRYLQLRLQMKGYRVLAAGDGKAGLDLFRQEHPDMVITDLNLSGIDGFHFLIRMHREDPDAKSKIVVFTDNREEDTISRCFKLGVADYITRPFSPVELEARIERLL